MTKVKLPREVAEEMEYFKLNKNLYEYLDCLSYRVVVDKTLNWRSTLNLDFDEVCAILARAWLDGYEIEEEQKYYIQTPKTWWAQENVPEYLYKSCGISISDKDFGVDHDFEDEYAFTMDEIKHYKLESFERVAVNE